MDPELKKRLLALIGEEAKDLRDAELLSAAATFAEEATTFNEELATANATLTTELSAATQKRDELQVQVTELSAAAKSKDGIELSASQKSLYGENALLKIDGIATKQNWSTATINAVKAKLGGDTINLSASAAGEVAQTIQLSVLLDILGEQPVAGLKKGEQTPGNLTNMSREASNESNTAPKSGNPLLETANSLKK